MNDSVFLKWCGFKRELLEDEYSGRPDTERGEMWIAPDGDIFEEVEFTLDFLFKYAVPKLRDLSENNTLRDIEFHWQGININDYIECNVILDGGEYCGIDEDSAIALKKAIEKAIEVSNPYINEVRK